MLYNQKLNNFQKNINKWAVFIFYSEDRHKFLIVQGVSDETYLFYFDIALFWKSILNFRLLENNELICPFYACSFAFENLDFGKKVFARAGIRTRHFMSKKREPYHSAMKVS
jgi:hypothetical protein